MKERKLIDLNLPEDLCDLDDKQLAALADEIRCLIIDVVARTGGHLAPSLGTVELTIALHAAFCAPVDKIIWDVGHQAYTHKILTKRAETFQTIRCLNGLSGFPRRDESPYDAFGVGHSSTSVSAALGIAVARDMQQENYNVVAIIGDAAISSGMAFEAMNHAGISGTKLIVVLNDNGMSIGANVGALSRYLSRIRLGQRYQKVKGDVETILKKVPGVGGGLLSAYEKAKDSMKQIILPGMLFEDLGFTYYGPIDGHNMSEMHASFEKAKKLAGPVLLHVYTQKGKGYCHAEEQPARFHGVGPFFIESGEKNGQEAGPTYSQVFGNSMVSLAKDNAKIVAISAAMVDGTGLKDFFASYPERSFDVGIGEQHAVTFAAGMATEGFRPVVSIYSTFMQRCYDQILHDVCLQKLPVVLALDRAGIVGEDGPTHHGVFDLSYLSHIPHLQILAPADCAELHGMLAYAMNQDGPVAIRYPRGTCPQFTNDYQPIECGQSILLQQGNGVAVFAIGSMVGEACSAAQILADEEIVFTLVNGRFAKPLDLAMIDQLVANHHTLITIEENSLAGGIGSVIAEHLLTQGCRIHFKALGISDEFVRHGKREELLQEQGIDAVSIADIIRESMHQKNRDGLELEQKNFFSRLFAGNVFNGR